MAFGHWFKKMERANFNRIKDARFDPIARMSPVQLTALEIAADFGDRARLGMYLGIVKRIGVIEARRVWSEIRADGANNRAALFCWKTKKIKGN